MSAFTTGGMLPGPGHPLRQLLITAVSGPSVRGAIEKLEEIRWWDYGPDILKGLDLNHPEEAVKYLEERAARGFPLYTPDKFLFHPKEGIIERAEGKVLLYKL